MKKISAGFTLMELLIVVAIIAILATVVALNYNSSLRKSAESLTKGNLGAIRSAIGIYYSDNDAMYPRDDLSSMTATTRYLQKMPITRIVPYHLESLIVTPEAIVTETGAWSYNNDDTQDGWGSIHVGCLEMDSRNQIWSTY